MIKIETKIHETLFPEVWIGRTLFNLLVYNFIGLCSNESEQYQGEPRCS